MALNNNQIEMQYGIDNYHNWVHVTCRRAGKTYGAANIIRNQLLKPLSTVIATSNHFGYRNYLYETICSLIPKSLISVAKKSENELILINGSMIKVVSPRLPNYPEYYKKPILAVFDEMLDESFNDLLDYMIMSNVKCLVTATPNGRYIPNVYTLEETMLYKLVQKGKNPIWPMWGTKSYSWKNVETLSKEVIDEISNCLTKKSFETEYEVKFSDD